MPKMINTSIQKSYTGILHQFPEVDFARGIAVIMMVVFHFMWDLSYFNGTSPYFLYDGFWGFFQNITGGLFLFLVGLSLTFSYSKSRDGYFVKFMAKGFRIFCYGLIITILSYFFADRRVVFFGILHFIGISIMISAFFIREKYLNLILGIGILTTVFWLDKIKLEFPWLVWVWRNYAVNTLDLYPLFPWLGVVFLGIFAGHIFYPEGKSIFEITLRRFFLRISEISRPVEFLGRNSLLLYFLHLPIAFLAAYLFVNFS